jgi:hypothetical protein
MLLDGGLKCEGCLPGTLPQILRQEERYVYVCSRVPQHLNWFHNHILRCVDCSRMRTLGIAYALYRYGLHENDLNPMEGNRLFLQQYSSTNQG